MISIASLFSIVSVAQAANSTYLAEPSIPVSANAQNDPSLVVPSGNSSSSVSVPVVPTTEAAAAAEAVVPADDIEPTRVYSNTSSSSNGTAAAFGASTFIPQDVTVTTRVVDTLHVPCTGPTTVTTNGQTYTVTEATTLTITDCPCTVVESTTSTVTDCSASATPSESASQQIDAVASAPFNSTTTIKNKSTVTVPCSGPTEYTHGNSVYTVTEPTTLYITYCPEETDSASTSAPKTIDAEASVETPKSTVYSTLTEKVTLTTRLVKTVVYADDKTSTISEDDVCQPVTVTVTEYNNGPAPAAVTTSSANPTTVAGIASARSSQGVSNQTIALSKPNNSTNAPEISNGSSKLQISGLATAVMISIGAFLL